MKSMSVHPESSALTVGVSSHLLRIRALPGRSAVASVAGRAPFTGEPLPAIIAAEMRKAGEALVRSRRVRRCAERLMCEHFGTKLW